jgi:hypothetical protein
VILPALLVLVSVVGFWLTAMQVRDFRKRQGEFSEWIVSDATPINRWLWRANAWIQMVLLPFASVVALICAFKLT